MQREGHSFEVEAYPKARFEEIHREQGEAFMLRRFSEREWVISLVPS
jgi:hypothetical protein